MRSITVEFEGEALDGLDPSKAEIVLSLSRGIAPKGPENAEYGMAARRRIPAAMARHFQRPQRRRRPHRHSSVPPSRRTNPDGSLALSTASRPICGPRRRDDSWASSDWVAFLCSLTNRRRSGSGHASRPTLWVKVADRFQRAGVVVSRLRGAKAMLLFF